MLIILKSDVMCDMCDVKPTLVVLTTTSILFYNLIDNS